MLKEEKVKIGDREITVTELSFASQLRLEQLGEITSEAIYKECLNKEDFEFLQTINREEGKNIRDTLNRVNCWNKKEVETTKNL